MAYQPLPPVGQDDMAGSLPVVIASDQSAVSVSGTVTANLSATDNAVLDNIDADLTTIIGHVDGIEGHVDGIETLIGTTNTTLTTIDGRVDGIETLIGTTNSSLTTIDGRVDGLETSNSAIQTAVQLIDDTVQVLGTDTYTEATSKGITLGAVRRDADTTLVNTTNEFTPLQVDANGRLKVEAFSGETLPVSLASVPSHAVTNAGTFVTQENGAALTAMQLLDDTIFTDDNAFTPATSKVSAIGLIADETSPDSVDEGDIGIPRMTLDRKQIVTAYPSSTTGDGLSVANFNSGDTFTALTNSAQVIKASAGNFYGYYIYNPNSSATYVMLYNTAAASVTVGTTTPAMVFCIPPTAGANLSLTYPIPFTNAGWSIAAATTGGGNSAPATALEAMIFYR